LALAAAVPCISRDGVLYCWFARDLGHQGVSALKNPEYQQHPLFPLAILSVQRTLQAFGVADTPLAWQRSGQIVAWTAGMAVVAVAGTLAVQLVRRLHLRVDRRHAALVALALAGLLPLNTWLSADVMSEQLHLALYLGAALMLLRLTAWQAALGCGVLSGLAFVTRPEGAVVCFAGCVVLLSRLRAYRWRVVVTRAVALGFGFLVCAGPYMATIGKISPKFGKQTLEEFQVAVGLAQPTASGRADWPQHAALLRHDYAWYELVPFALYQTFRAGRVIVPLLALPLLVNLRRRFRRSPLLGIGVCMLTHFSLTVLLAQRHGYLDPRHTLAVVMLVLPFAGILLAGLFDGLWRRARPVLAYAAVALSLLPLVVYALRVPNGADAFLTQAAHWLRQYDPQAASKLLIGGKSERRLAFYAGMRIQHWPENEPGLDRRYARLRAHLLESQPRPDYFAMETGPGEERAGNDQLLEMLQAEERVTAHAAEVHVERTRRGDALHIWRFTWEPSVPPG
jgi:hypothetical protein